MNKFILREFISKTFNIKGQIVGRCKKIVILYYKDLKIEDYCTIQEEELNV